MKPSLLLRNTRKTGTVSITPLEALRSSFSVWRRASAPFALPRNTRKTGDPKGFHGHAPTAEGFRTAGSSAPTQGPAGFFLPWRRAAATFALLALISAAALCAQERITFTKSFPSSVPEYCSVQVGKDGSLEYKEAPVDDHPVRAQLAPADVNALFDMAAKLDHFKGKLESGLKVANTGKKTFRYQSADGAAITETVFNYSIDVTAQQLLEKFEQIAASERAYLDLDRTVHFDKLGVNDALAEIEALWLNKQLVAPRQFIPLLTRIANHESFMHLARDRAARLKEGFAAQP